MQPRLAVLIDAENVPSKYWTTIREELASTGIIISCRLFGDFGDGRLSKWLKIAQEAALQPVMQLAGRNAGDIAMTIAAMDILHSSKVEGICLISSDHDFAPLALRLRGAGLRVYGFGEAKTPPALRIAFTSFTVLGATAKPVVAPKAKAA